MAIKYVDRITVEDFLSLRDVTGELPIHPDQVEASLKGCIVVAAQDGDKVVGCMRIIWDGGYCAYLKNIMVLPDYQGKGIASEIVRRAIEYMKNQLKPGYGIVIDGVPYKSTQGLWGKLGFKIKKNQCCAIEIYVKCEAPPRKLPKLFNKARKNYEFAILSNWCRLPNTAYAMG